MKAFGVFLQKNSPWDCWHIETWDISAESENQNIEKNPIKLNLHLLFSLTDYQKAEPSTLALDSAFE